MMCYATIEQYGRIGGVYDEPEDEVQRRLCDASRKIDELTFGRIRAKGLEKLTSFQRDCVTYAVCQQAAYLRDHADSEGDLTGYSVGDISVTVGQTGGEAAQLAVSAAALSVLRQSGLMDRRL